MSSKDFEELENELLKDQDSYEKEIKEKQSRRLYMSNFLESKEQSKNSSLGGQMFTSKATVNKDEA